MKKLWKSVVYLFRLHADRSERQHLRFQFERLTPIAVTFDFTNICNQRKNIRLIGTKTIVYADIAREKVIVYLQLGFSIRFSSL